MPRSPWRPNLPVPTLGGRQIWGDVFVYAGFRIQRNAFTDHHRLLDPLDVRLAWGTFDECLDDFNRMRARRGAFARGDQLVLLLHGIFRTKDAFRPMRKSLANDGFAAEAVNYPSTRASLADHAAQVDELLGRVAVYTEGEFPAVSLVGHSMGGIVARLVADRRTDWDGMKLNRIVTIGSPNQGAHIIPRLRDVAGFDAIAGPAGRALAPDAFPTLGPPPVPIGVVAGVKGDGVGYNPLLPGDDDMTVAIESALLPGAEDTLLVPGGVHTFLAMRPDVIAAVRRYLRTGSFRSNRRQSPSS